MSGANHPSSATRRTVLAGLAATLGSGSVAATGRPTHRARCVVNADQPATDVDADNLVAGNSQYTITVKGVAGSAIETTTVTIGGIAFASVEVLERDPAVLVVDPSNLVESESIRNEGTVEVSVLVETGSRRITGTEEVQVITD